MKNNVRAAVAAIAISQSNGRSVSSVYDYSTSGYRNIDVKIVDGRVSAYDYSSSCHIDGNLPSLYHYGESCHLDLQPRGGGKFGGYDYGASCHFEVTVRGNTADVYDYGASSYFSYSL